MRTIQLLTQAVVVAELVAGAGPDLSWRMMALILDTSFTVLLVLGLKSHSLDTLQYICSTDTEQLILLLSTSLHMINH